MKIVIYKKVKEFIEDNNDIILKNESLNQLIIINSNNNSDKNVSEDILFGKVEDENGNVNLIFCSVKPYNLVIYSNGENTNESTRVLAEYLLKEDISINGINANKEICDVFIEIYKAQGNYEFKEKLAMDIMELRELRKDIKLPIGSFREANLRDLDLVVDWDIKFTKEALNEDVKEKIHSRIENKQIFIFEDEENRPMAMAAMTRQLKLGVSISLVYSCKEGRGKGYGLGVVYNVCKTYLERGNEFCTLFVDKRNPISNALYEKIGFIILEDQYDYRII